MTVAELLAMLGVKDPEALSKLQNTVSEVTKTLASWGEQARQWSESLDPSTREFLVSVARAQAQSKPDADGGALPWWTEPTVTVPHRTPATDPAVSADMEAMKARISELEDQFEKATGRSVPDAFPPNKKKGNDPPS